MGLMGVMGLVGVMGNAISPLCLEQGTPKLGEFFIKILTSAVFSVSVGIGGKYWVIKLDCLDNFLGEELSSSAVSSNFLL